MGRGFKPKLKNKANSYSDSIRRSYESIPESEGAGKENVYTCACGKHTKTVNKDGGVTPMLIGCECGKLARSHFFKIDGFEGLEASIEFYKPSLSEFAKLDRESMEHVRNGGLLKRDFKPVFVNVEPDIIELKGRSLHLKNTSGSHVISVNLSGEQCERIKSLFNSL